ncbi:MAG: hypothetical protein SFV52_13335 [Saprospiraceae bacterium]|nr:hypothetical protein [Saprospiraceae bacterium]
MFRRFAMNVAPRGRTLQARADGLYTALNIKDLMALMEMGWAFLMRNPNAPLGSPINKSSLLGLPQNYLNTIVNQNFNQNQQLFTLTTPPSQGVVISPHLIYALLIDQTGCVEIFREAIRKIRNGELEFNPNNGALQYVRNTEMLWFSNPPVDSTFNLFSWIHPDIQTIKNNAFYSMFGFVPASVSGQPAPDPGSLPRTAYKNFQADFQKLGEEWHVAFASQNVTSGINLTDDETMQFKCAEIRRNFLAQRNNGFLSLIEYYLNCRYSWFHLSLEAPCPLLEALGINEQSPAQRLFALANKVGVPAHAMSETLFRMADPASLILSAIEAGIFDQNAVPLYNRTVLPPSPTTLKTNPIPPLMNIFLNGWSTLTGRDLKIRQEQMQMPMQRPVSNVPTGNGAV